MTPRAPRPRTAAPPPSRRAEWAAALGVGVASLVALLWASRGALLGVPAADDYDYLAALRFERPLDWLGPMGSIWYWRPLSRQLYFTALDGAFFQAPLVVAAVHALLLAALFVLAYRAARAAFDPWGASAIAAFPLLAEPTRELLAWPTAAQPLLAMTLIALAVHEAVARRWWSAALALLGAFLAHEQALLAAPLVPLVFAARERERTPRRRMVGLTLAACAVYGLGRTLAFAHGAALPARGSTAEAIAAAPSVLARSVSAQMNFALLEPGPRGAVMALTAILLVSAALVLLTRRQRLKGRLLAAGALWFVLGVLPLAYAAALWTPRHSSVPSLGLGLLVCGLLACAAPRLALAFTAVRLVALLLAPTATPAMSARLEARIAPMSFLHVARLQRTADSARHALLAGHPHAPESERVGYWSLPRETQIAFAGAKALRVWYGDPRLEWSFWERFTPGQDRSGEPILGFNVETAEPAVLMNARAVRRYQDGIDAWTGGALAPAQQAFAEAIALQKPEIHNFTNETVRLMARIAYAQGRFAQADSLNRIDYRMSGPSPTYFGMEAMLAITAGDSARAAQAAERGIALRPGDEEATAVLKALGRGER